MTPRPEAHLHAYQEEYIDWYMDAPELGTLGYMGVGAGKTAASLTAVQRTGKWPVLITAPLRVANNVWPQEPEQWEHLAGLEVNVVTGPPKKRLAALLDRSAQVYVINYDNIVWAMEQIENHGLTYNSLIVDEITKFKSRGARYKAFHKWANSVPCRQGLTGTPTGNTALGIWPQAQIIADKNPLARSFTQFKKKHFYLEDPYSYNWKLFPGAMDDILMDLKEYVYCMDPDDYQDLPELLLNPVAVDLPAGAWKHYRRMRRELSVELAENRITAVNMAVACNKLKQIACGVIYDAARERHVVHEERLQAVEDIFDENGRAPMLVCYEYEFQRDAVLQRFPEAILLSDDTIDEWNAGRIPMYVLHAASAGHGLNLQAGGNHLLIMSPMWSFELYEQLIGRLRRQGQAASTVHVHALYTKGTVEENALSNLDSHGTLQSEYMAKALKLNKE